MKKMTFLGLGDEKERFVKRLQELGIVHLDLPGESVLPADTARELQRVTEIRKFLSRISEKGGTTRDTEGDYSQICARREELGQKESRLSTEISALKKEQASLEPWGNFKPEDIALLRSRGLEVHFYRVSRKIFETLPLEGTLCEVLSGPTAGEAVFALFSAYAVNLEIPEEKLPAKSLADISAEIKAKETELAEISKAYIELSAKIAALEKAEADLTDIFEYRKALLNAGSELEDRLFVLKCWSPVPEDRLVESLGTDFKFVCLTEEPEPGDRVPVLLKNKPTFNSGEDLVKVYSHPNYSDFDPSGLVLYWFVVFYGMIIGDAGYGQCVSAHQSEKQFRSVDPFPAAELHAGKFGYLFRCDFGILFRDCRSAGKSFEQMYAPEFRDQRRAEFCDAGVHHYGHGTCIAGFGNQVFPFQRLAVAGMDYHHLVRLCAADLEYGERGGKSDRAVDYDCGFCLGDSVHLFP
ncbi:MAG: hypothetical protein BWK80_28435 [Desulfobacteraceae bacterium IS3]|nr:MAG: hypothetical protein BWK80_28435 [Desulfobacteraceae bacterium IS3]